MRREEWKGREGEGVGGAEGAVGKEWGEGKGGGGKGEEAQ